MDKRHTPIKMFKRILIGCSLFALMLIFSGCSQDIPEGNIKDFVEQFDYNRAFDQIDTGKSVITSIYYENEVEKGKVVLTTWIDKKNEKYHFMDTQVSGNYIGEGGSQYDYEHREVLCYLNEKKEAIVYQKTDGKLDEIDYREEDVYTSINQFFYRELDAGYHRGGVYYGDYILVNCAKYYSCFSLNDAKTELSYAVNTSNKDTEGNELVTMHQFVVDSFGMIIALNSKSILIEKNITIETSIQCEYNLEFEKIYEL